MYFIDRIEIIVIFLKLKFSILPIRNNNSDFVLNNYKEKNIDNLLRKLMIVGVIFLALVSIFLIAFVIYALISLVI